MSGASQRRRREEGSEAPSKRALATRTALLSAAQEIFVRYGYEAATIAAIVERSGTSTGSLYNQFGGKPGLFFALRSELSERLWTVTAEAIDSRRAAGDQDPLSIYLAGARAYLMACWDERAVAAVLLSGDAPHGVEAIRHAQLHRWIGQNAAVLQVHDRLFGEELAAAVTAVVAAAVPQILTRESRRDAAALTDYFAELITRLMRPGAP